MGRRSAVVVGLASALTILGPAAVAHAAPWAVTQQVAESSAVVDNVVELTDQRTAVFVDSPSMGRVVQVQILHPEGDEPRPSLYLLDGVNAGSESNYQESTWTQMTDVVEFFADKNVNVVLPIGGLASYYTDWAQADPVLGENQWETFLTRELPPIVDGQFNGNGVNAIAGLSMGAQGAMTLITRNPDLYSGVAAFSGCMDTTRLESELAVRGTVASRGGNPDNMWGPPGGPGWLEHDPTANAESLRGKDIFVSTGNGLPGPYEVGAPDMVEKVVIGGPLEIVSNWCTQLFQQRLEQLGIPATYLYRPYGTHSWPYWQDDLHEAWPTLARSLGV
ncbi:alpha/beta hydrolase [Rhodococcus xishaensis]|uniref:Esterase family protein n=1 Tax=Rhodococcus xishaensis TaxID=2487364 RepID=A0A3S3B0F6_9NOCA|nr:alpha/beta hydrolase family protein [Rhodococcus xishaensis]RVW00154.1 esterase family protein [Rhodococcus xishaensis]